MKTSKIIFISFFGIVVLFLLSLLIQTDPEKRANKELSEMKKEEVALPTIFHLIVNEGCNVRIARGVSDSIKIGYRKDLVLEHSIYTVSGDTLIINKFPNDKGFYTDILCSKLTAVQIKNSYVNIDQNYFPELNIEGANSTIDINNNVSIQLANIDLKAGSRLWYNNSKLEKLQLNLEKSRADFDIDQIAELKAELRDSSELTVQKVLRSDVQTDETSRYYSR
jgi:hypothetical protein